MATHVLVADDSGLDRLVLRAMVEGLGHTCDEAADGTDAWAMLERQEYGAILTDWMMPGLSGLDLCRRIRERADAPYLFTVVCTSLGERARGVEAVRAGADALLTKPVDLLALEMCLIAAERTSAIHRQLARQNAELQALNVVLAEHARTDPLTGLANRRLLDADVERLISLAGRYGLPTAVAMCDVDRFKAYNDRFGHPAGDRLLQELASILAQTCREADTLYRYGGEELLVLLPWQDLASATVAAERLRQAVEGAALPHPDNAPFGVVTVSVGVAELPMTGSIDVPARVAEADAALYEAKRNGRNRVVVRDGRPATV